MPKDFDVNKNDFRHRLYCYVCGQQGLEGDFEWSSEHYAYVCEKHLYQPARLRDEYEVNLDESDYLSFSTVQRIKPGVDPVWGSEPGVIWGSEGTSVRWGE